jgi:hypothetical protein
MNNLYRNGQRGSLENYELTFELQCGLVGTMRSEDSLVFRHHVAHTPSAQ